MALQIHDPRDRWTPRNLVDSSDYTTTVPRTRCALRSLDHRLAAPRSPVADDLRTP
jgi:hypothetical protein